ncbi:hypothetical protein AWC38_SpisGene18770 [Stylophora pistillata]|uniref:Reverse transcriptase domain-containing protein n=1 Tax=Stylophora pistillata TaxID=50429 RepID=A0A2B4RKN7_STYPI|nr:hypothetical protein AWC38_SpisGene18770 [Stylophora pistillata]
MEWVARNKLAIPNILHILDDFLILEKSHEIFDASLQRFLQFCDDIGVHMAPDKTEGPSPVLTFADIELDCSDMEARLPKEKVDKTLDAIRSSTQEKSTTERTPIPYRSPEFCLLGRQIPNSVTGHGLNTNPAVITPSTRELGDRLAKLLEASLGVTSSMALLLILLQVSLMWPQSAYSGEQKKGNDALNPQSSLEIEGFRKRITLSDAALPPSVSRTNSWKGKREAMSDAALSPSIFKKPGFGKRELAQSDYAPLPVYDLPPSVSRTNSWKGKREAMSDVALPPSIFKKPGFGKRELAQSDYAPLPVYDRL